MRLIRKEDGFTLVEIILAIIIISIGVLGLVSAISFTTGKSINAEVVSTAKELAQERMEELLAKKRDTGYATTPDLDIGTTTTALPGPFTGYTRIVEVCNVDGSLGNPDCTLPDNGSGFKKITVSINYSGLPDLPSPVVLLATVITDTRE